MKHVISVIIFLLALCQLAELGVMVGTFKMFIFALCAVYVFNFIISMIVAASDTTNRDAGQTKREQGHSLYGD